MPSILLIRHAQASFGAVNYDRLSERGHEQVAALVAGLARRGIVADRVFCGSLRRQLDTAIACAAAAGVEVEIDTRWDEFDDRDILTHHGDAQVGLERRPGDARISSREFQEILNGALQRWITAGTRSPARESWPRFLARATGALEEVAAGLGRGQTALVISSGGVIGALSIWLLGLAPERLIAFNHVSINTAISKLAVGRAGITLLSSNEHAHLEEAGRTLVSYR